VPLLEALRHKAARQVVRTSVRAGTQLWRCQADEQRRADDGRRRGGRAGLNVPPGGNVNGNNAARVLGNQRQYAVKGRADFARIEAEP